MARATALPFRQSPNHRANRNNWSPSQTEDCICHHVTEGAFDGSASWITQQRSQVSYSFMTAQDGRYQQFVQLGHMAWANGNGPANFARALFALIRNRQHNANLYTVSVGNEGWSWQRNFGIPTKAQRKAIWEVHKIIVDHFLTRNPNWRASRENVFGHCHVRPDSNPTCPAPNFGERFPWDELIQEINSYIDSGCKTVPEYTTVEESRPDENNDPECTIAEELCRPSCCAVTAAGIQVGTIVKVRGGALTYDGGGAADFVYNRAFEVSSFSGERVVLAGIDTAFNVRDLIALDRELPAQTEIREGSYVRIIPGANWMIDQPRPVPAWVLPMTLRVDELRGERAVLNRDGINSPINIRDLKLV